jgi:hypothetical protein
MRNVDINPMRTILIALLMTLATQAGADTKKYGKKECNDISAVIDFLLSNTPNLWSKLEKNPTDEETALELSWTVDLAANYTTIYEAFCTSED